MRTTTTDVLIVGAGPTGLSLATALAVRGIRATVVGRQAAGANTSRVAVVYARTPDDGHDSHKIRHKFFKWLRHIELAANSSSSEKFGSIHFATLFEITVTRRLPCKPPIITEFARCLTIATNLGK